MQHKRCHQNYTPEQPKGFEIGLMFVAHLANVSAIMMAIETLTSNELEKQEVLCLFLTGRGDSRHPHFPLALSMYQSRAPALGQPVLQGHCSSLLSLLSQTGN